MRHLRTILLTSILVTWAGAAPSMQDEAPPPPAAEEDVERALSTIDGLRDEDLRFEGDIPILSGIANDQAVRDQASDVVESLLGTGIVRNEIQLSNDFSERFEGAATRVGASFDRWLAVLPLLPIAVAIVVAGAILAWLVGRWRWAFRHLSGNPFLNDISRRLTQSAIVVGSVLLALEVLDATALVGGVLGAAGVAGIAIGFAFKDLIENYIASILLSLRQPFRPRDHVVIDGHEGLVTSMNSRTTVLTTFDGNIVRIPNATVFTSTLVNYSSDSRRRFSFKVGVGYDVDLGEAVRVGVEVIRSTDGVMSDPAPFAIVTDLGDSSVSVTLYGWVDQAAHDFGKVRSSAMQAVKVAYDARDIDMPEPIYSIKLRTTSEVTSGPASKEDAAPAPGPTAPVHDVDRDDTAAVLAAGAEDAETNLLTEDAPRE
ncbi:MAG: mechanosensitive ion channel family protein [Phycisphaerales bacterium]|nr:mechanosensitive ion channel family protein [Phycisphaerales bacterium]